MCRVTSFGKNRISERISARLTVKVFKYNKSVVNIDNAITTEFNKLVDQDRYEAQMSNRAVSSVDELHEVAVESVLNRYHLLRPEVRKVEKDCAPTANLNNKFNMEVLEMSEETIKNLENTRKEDLGYSDVDVENIESGVFTGNLYGYLVDCFGLTSNEEVIAKTVSASSL